MIGLAVAWKQASRSAGSAIADQSVASPKYDDDVMVRTLEHGRGRRVRFIPSSSSIQVRAFRSFRAVAAVGFFAVATISTAGAAEISGAGATFPYPIYAKWAEAYRKETGIRVNYQPIGSGDGIYQIQSKEVTFGASDMPLAAAELEMDGLVQFPTVVGGIAVVVNIEGVRTGELTLDGPSIAKIFLGEIRSWNDAAIRKLNPNVKLPSQAIAVVHRSDGSGTTFAFTNYLSKVSADWGSKVGSITSVEWPTGTGARGNQGVTNAVAGTKGSIGYVEYAYAKQNTLAYAKLVNKNGKTVAPTIGSFAAAASDANWEGTPGFGVILTDGAGAATWPVAGATFILMHKQADDPAAAGAALKFFDWAYAKGGKMAQELDYVPLPGNVVTAVRKLWATQVRDARGKPLYISSK
jgi:phosphate transport system substrate-binding protein